MYGTVTVEPVSALFHGSSVGFLHICRVFLCLLQDLEYRVEGVGRGFNIGA